MKFEQPQLNIIYFDVKDVLTASPEWEEPSDWELPIVTGETDPEPTGWETPILP